LRSAPISSERVWGQPRVGRPQIQTFRGFRVSQSFGTSELQLLIPTFARFLSSPFEKRSLLRGASHRNGCGCPGFRRDHYSSFRLLPVKSAREEGALFDRN